MERTQDPVHPDVQAVIVRVKDADVKKCKSSSRLETKFAAALFLGLLETYSKVNTGFIFEKIEKGIDR